MIFEFTLVPGREGKMEANEMTLVANYAPHLRPPASPAAATDTRPGRPVAPRLPPAPEAGEAERLVPPPSSAWGRAGLDKPPPAAPQGGR